MTVIGGEAVILYGLDANGNFVPLKLNADGTLSSTGGGAATQITETSGPTILSIGAIPDGDLLKRSGSNIIGVANALEVIDLPFAYNTPNVVLTGITLWTPRLNDTLLGLAIYTTTAFNNTGGTPRGIVYIHGSNPFNSGPRILLVSLGVQDAAYKFGTETTAVAALADSSGIITLNKIYGNTGVGPLGIRLTDTTPWDFVIGTSTGVDPGSTQGEGFVRLMVLHAP